VPASSAMVAPRVAMNTRIGAYNHGARSK